MNRHVLFAALLLAACGQQQPSPEPPLAEPTAVADVTASSWPADYSAMRQGAAGWAADELASEQDAASRTQADDQPDQPFDLISCAEPDSEPGEVDARTARLTELAHEAVLIEARMKAAGYDPEIWRKPLETLQASALKLLETDVPEWGTPVGDALDARLSALLEQAAATMELNRQTLQPAAPRILAEGGCGAAEAPFLVTTDPPGGRVWLATRFTFQTCQALGKSAWDLTQCRWTEMAPDRKEYLSGNYMVQAKWPDGRSLRSSQRFTGDSESEDPVTVAIRPG